MSMEKIDFIKKPKIIAIFMALITWFIINVFSASDLINLSPFSISVWIMKYTSIAQNNGYYLRWRLHDPSLPEWNFTLSSWGRFHPTIVWDIWENQISFWQAGSFSSGICLDLLTISFFFFCSHVMNYFFIMLRQVEVITWKNFVPTKWALGSARGILLCLNETLNM